MPACDTTTVVRQMPTVLARAAHAHPQRQVVDRACTDKRAKREDNGISIIATRNDLVNEKRERKPRERQGLSINQSSSNPIQSNLH